ncbi:MAG TPA: hypothetical protein VJ970_02880 [Flavobacteriaceae bacterium]|nr:hypothetical protein [Flavobacteriaceae bacterium]
MTRNFIVVLTLFIAITSSFAQKNNVSPYSYFGMGDKSNSNTVENLSMGGIGVAYGDFYHINFSNPASYSNLQFTAYGLSGESKSIWADDGNDSQRATSTYLSSLTVGIPLSKKGGLSFGVLPNTSVGYSLRADKYDGDQVTEATFYEGSGGTNKVYLGAGYQLFKGFSLGLQGNYVFGTIESMITNQQLNASLGTRYVVESKVKGYAYNVGLQYNTKLNEKLFLYAGANFDLKNELETEGNELLFTVDLSNNVVKDEYPNTEKDSEGSITNPLKSTLGLGFGTPNKWFAAVNYSLQEPIKTEGSIFSLNSNYKYGNYSKLAVGGYFTPNVNSLTNYWKRVTYRAGVKFENTGLMVNSNNNSSNFNEIKDFGISFGVGLPLSTKTLSNINMGLEVGRRGENTNGLVKETYLNFRIGLSLNDKWFKKRQIF